MKEEYTRDYFRPSPRYDADIDPSEKQAFNQDIMKEVNKFGFDLFELYRLYGQKVPKHIVEKDRQNYEYLLKRCDQWAERFDGRVYGEVDYEKYGAKIELTVPSFFEFAFDEDLLFLQEIGEKARNVLIRPNFDENSITLRIFINYFAEDESIEDFLSRHIKAYIQRNGLALEEVSAKIGISVEELLEMLGE